MFPYEIVKEDMQTTEAELLLMTVYFVYYMVLLLRVLHLDTR